MKNDSELEGLVQYDTNPIEPSNMPLAALFLFYPSDPNLVNGVSRYETSFQNSKK